MTVIRYLPAFSLIVLFLYPAYLVVTVTIDSLIGEKLFYSEIQFSYWANVTATVMSDWLHAMPYALAIGLILTIVSVWFPPRLLPSLACGSLVGSLLGLIAGVATEPLVGISLGLALVMTSPLLCLRKEGV